MNLRTSASRRPDQPWPDQPWSVLEVDVWPYSWPRPVVRRERVTLTGQLSTSRDILVRDVRAPGLRAGDRVVFSLAGAYTSSVPHRAFASFPEPGFHFVDPGTDGDQSR